MSEDQISILAAYSEQASRISPESGYLIKSAALKFPEAMVSVMRANLFRAVAYLDSQTLRTTTHWPSDVSSGVLQR